jgi:hypothetical protein
MELKHYSTVQNKGRTEEAFRDTTTTMAADPVITLGIAWLLVWLVILNVMHKRHRRLHVRTTQ